jgi:3-isopropylmalate dehydrogenase
MGVKKHILVIPGDGIGPEVTTWGKAVLEKIGADFGHEFTFDEALMGHAGIEATGEPAARRNFSESKSQ